MLYYSVFEFETDGGIMVTGSHNPPHHNGFKMMLGQDALYGEQIQELGKIAVSGAFSTGQGKAEQVEIKAIYAKRLLKDFEGAALNVAWDPANGATGAISSRSGRSPITAPIRQAAANSAAVFARMTSR